MARHRIEPLVHFLRKMARPMEPTGLSDGQLIGRFLETRDQFAFDALVRRHAGMVFAVCRRITRNHADAEDTFQATFLVLARRAASIASREAVGSWLFAVAYRTALAARAASERRRAKEDRVKEMGRRTATRDDLASQELRELLDHALSELPEKYRLPVVLCELEGMSRKEVARRLRIAEGTLSSRLATARKLLARRLAKYGPFSSVAMAAALAEAASAEVPQALLNSTVQVATGAVSAHVATLAHGVIVTMLMIKPKALVWATVVALTLGAGAISLTMARQAPNTPAPKGVERKTRTEELDKPAQGETPSATWQHNVGLSVRVFIGDRQANQENSTKVLSECHLYTEVGRPFELGGEIAKDDERLGGRSKVQSVEIGTSVRGTVTTNSGGGFSLDAKIEHIWRAPQRPGGNGSPNKSERMELQGVSTRTILELRRGEWNRLECGKALDGKNIWAEVRLDYSKWVYEEYEELPTKKATPAAEDAVPRKVPDEGTPAPLGRSLLDRAEVAFRKMCRGVEQGAASIAELTQAEALLKLVRGNAEAIEARQQKLAIQAVQELERQVNNLPIRPRMLQKYTARPSTTRTPSAVYFCGGAWRKLGVRLEPVTASEINQTHSQLHGGMKVVEVRHGGPASKANIHCGDILVGLHNWEVLSEANVEFVLSRPDLHTALLRFYVLRGGQVHRGFIEDWTLEDSALECPSGVIEMPFRVDPRHGEDITAVRLYVSEDRGQTWRPAGECAATETAFTAFNYVASHDGTFWFALQAVTRDGKIEPEMRELRADLKINVVSPPKTSTPIK